MSKPISFEKNLNEIMFDICVFLVLFLLVRVRTTLHKHVEFGREKLLCDECYTPDVKYEATK